MKKKRKTNTFFLFLRWPRTRALNAGGWAAKTATPLDRSLRPRNPTASLSWFFYFLWIWYVVNDDTFGFLLLLLLVPSATDWKNQNKQTEKNVENWRRVTGSVCCFHPGPSGRQQMPSVFSFLCQIRERKCRYDLKAFYVLRKKSFILFSSQMWISFFIFFFL